jgi:ADP-ribose pyrophosphatase YjhB (NUDIX family)
MQPRFQNQPNRPVPSPEGETVWVSRSVALVGEVCAYNLVEQAWYVLLVKRGTGTPDFQGFWCLPCGYLDWNETLTEGLLREVFEESGLYLPSLSSHEHFSHSPCSLTQQDYQQEMPWFISDIPNNTKQNISMHYAVLFAWNHTILPTLSNAHCEVNEVEDIQWMPLHKAKSMTLAFNHHVLLRRLCQELSADMAAVTTQSLK